MTTTHEMKIAQAVLEACKRAVSKNRSLEGLNLDAIVHRAGNRVDSGSKAPPPLPPTQTASTRPVPKDALSVPPLACDFKVGDTVTFTNDNGASFPGHKVVGFAPVVEHGRFVYVDIDCWWFPVTPGELSREIAANSSLST